MRMNARQPGSRRLGLPMEFPLIDVSGVFVLQERRRLTDRRQDLNEATDMEEPAIGGQSSDRSAYNASVIKR